MTIVSQPPVLTLDGDLNLNGANTDPSGITFRIETDGGSSAVGSTDGPQWGSPQAITRTIASWLADGSIVTQDGMDNRELTLSLRVKADTSAGLAAGEAALFNRCGRSTTLAWTPPTVEDDEPVTTMFEVWNPVLAGASNFVADQRYTRYYTLTLTAAPFSRSVSLVEYTAVSKPTTPDSVQVDACTSTTGWTGSPEPAGTTGTTVTETITTEISSRLGGGRQAGGATYHLSLTRDGAVDMTDYPYLRVAFSMPGVSWDPKVHADGVLLTQVASSGHVRWFSAPASFSTLKIGGSFYTNRQMTVVLSVFDVTKSNVAGAVYPDLDQELARTIWVEGSARTGGSLAIEHESTGLGTVVAYTSPASPAGYVPAMSGYWTAGPTRNSDSDAVSGTKSLIDNSSRVGVGSGVFPTFTIPGDQVIEGDYGVMARLKANTPGEYEVIVSTHVDGHSLTSELASVDSVVSVGSAYDLFWLGRITLPPLAIPATSVTDIIATILAVDATDPFAVTDTVYVDELWLFNLTDGAVSIVDVGTAKRVWFDSADMERSNPTIWVGSAADRSDAVAATLLGKVRAMGSHQLIPGYMDLFTVTTGASNADASVSYYPRWHTHAAL